MGVFDVRQDYRMIIDKDCLGVVVSRENDRIMLVGEDFDAIDAIATVDKNIALSIKDEPVVSVLAVECTMATSREEHIIARAAVDNDIGFVLPRLKKKSSPPWHMIVSSDLRA